MKLCYFYKRQYIIILAILKEKEMFLSVRKIHLYFFLSKQTDLMGEYTQTFNLPWLQLSFEFLSIINI